MCEFVQHALGLSYPKKISYGRGTRRAAASLQRQAGGQSRWCQPQPAPEGRGSRVCTVWIRRISRRVEVHTERLRYDLWVRYGTLYLVMYVAEYRESCSYTDLGATYAL